MQTNFHNKVQNLENAFFLEQDKVLIENMKKLEQKKRTKDELSQVSGIRDEEVLEKLVSLEINPKDMMAIAMVPLIEMAWADETLDPEEAKAVLLAVEKIGFPQESEVRQIVEEWLSHKPDSKLLEAWKHCMEELLRKLTVEEGRVLQDELLEHAKTVAEASGGFLGIGSISYKEKQLLKKLNGVFYETSKNSA